MPFKRKARLLFVSPHGSFRAPVATAFAHKIGAALCEARWASPRVGPGFEWLDEFLLARQLDLSQCIREPLTETTLHWADTVFVLESRENEVGLTLPAATQLRRYLVPECASAEDCAAVLAMIETQVRGIVGGLRMLKKLA